MRNTTLRKILKDECLYLRKQQFLSFYDTTYAPEHYTSCGYRYAALIDIFQQFGFDYHALESEIEKEMQTYRKTVENC